MTTSRKPRSVGRNSKPRAVSLAGSAFYEDLRNPAFAAQFLKTILAEESLEAFLVALRHVAEANGGIAALSKGAKLGRESVYKSLAKSGNPQFSTVSAMLRALGLRFSVEPKSKKAA